MYRTDTKTKEFKIIKISREIYDVLNNLGRINDTFNSVLTRSFSKNGLLGIVTDVD